MDAVLRRKFWLAAIAAICLVSLRGSPSAAAGPAGNSPPPDAARPPAGVLFQLGSSAFRGAGRLGALAFSPDAKLLAADEENSSICIWKVESVSVAKRLRLEYPNSIKLWFSGSPRELHCESWDRFGRGGMAHQHWALPDFVALPDLDIGEAERASIINPEAAYKRRVSVKPDHSVSVFDRESGAEALRVPPRKQPVSVELLAGQNLLAVSSGDAEGHDNWLELWDVPARKELQRWKTGNAVVSHFVLGPSGSILLGAAERSDVHCWDLKSGKELATIPNKDFFTGPTFVVSPDGKHLAATHEGVVDAFELPSGRKVHSFETIGFPSCTAFSGDGRLLAVGCGALAEVFDFNAGRELAVPMGHTSAIAAVAFSRDGARLSSLDSVFSSYGEQVAISWNLERRLPVGRFQMQGRTARLSVSSDGRFMVAERRTSIPLVWDVDRNTVVPPNRRRKPWPFAMAASRNGRLFLAHNDGSIAETNGFSCRGHVGEVLALAACADGSKIASVGTDKTLRVWKPGLPDELAKISLPTVPRPCVAISADAALVAAVADARLMVWKSSGGDLIHSLGLATESPTILRFSPDAKTIVVGTQSGRLMIYEVESGKLVQQASAHPGGVSAVEFSSDGSVLYSGGKDGVIRQWTPAKLQSPHIVAEKLAPILSLLWIGEGKRLAASDAAHLVAIYDTATARRLKAFRSFNPTELMYVQDRSAWPRPNRDSAPAAHPFWLCMVDAPGQTESRNLSTYERGGTQGIDLFDHDDNSEAISPDGKLIARATLAATRLWDTATGERSHDFINAGFLGSAVAFSHSGKLLAAAGDGIRTWRLDTEAPVFEIPKSDDGSVSELLFSPDDRLLLSSGEREHVKVWDTATGELLREFNLPNWFQLQHAAMTVDGRILLSINGRERRGSGLPDTSSP